ncbi:cyclin-dependent kinase inhibitor 1C-like [Thrips palmi]|uniref:Cyclin-dependent kinase inhibitor 1C-like n=1 Tax=Thrips palmi TaxID=161013 RepID=A0A6P8ZZF9_THRPL|nr:cyclin-dependent kinase inhibitor 1C-like [Thrips palmi]
MSVRVSNPFSLTEMRRLREAVVARPYRPDPEARARICRNLWGKSSADDSRAFAAKELAEHRERDAERWGFDFAREVPLRYGPGAGRYNWSKVLTGTVSAAYKMPRLEPLEPRMDRRLETARATVPCRDVHRCPEPQQPEASVTAEAATPPVPAKIFPATLAAQDLNSPPASTTSSAAASPAAPVRQTSMTEFLQVRKRSRSDVKHEENPAKRRKSNSQASH